MMAKKYTNEEIEAGIKQLLWQHPDDSGQRRSEKEGSWQPNYGQKKDQREDGRPKRQRQRKNQRANPQPVTHQNSAKFQTEPQKRGQNRDHGSSEREDRSGSRQRKGKERPSSGKERNRGYLHTDANKDGQDYVDRGTDQPLGSGDREEKQSKRNRPNKAKKGPRNTDGVARSERKETQGPHGDKFGKKENREKITKSKDKMETNGGARKNTSQEGKKNTPRTKKGGSYDKKGEKSDGNQGQRNKQQNREERENNEGPFLDSNEPKVTNEVLLELEKEGLYPLRKKSVRFPQARYFCRLCEYHCDTVAICRRHMKDTRHKRLKLIKTTDILLKSLPPPCEAHAEALTSLVDQVYRQYGMNAQERQQRLQVVEEVKEFIHSHIEKVELTVYGSTVTGFALKHSDINIDLSSNNAARTLAKLHIMLKDDTSGYFKEIQTNFSAKVPCIRFKDSKFNFPVQVSINSSTACETTQLLAAYAKIDSRVIPLAITFRYWAKLCRIDNQDIGTMPSYVFGLMTIYFLQHSFPPILPVLHEIEPLDGSKTGHNIDYYFKDTDKLCEKWSSRNTQSFGQLWYDLLRFYSIQFDITNCVISLRKFKKVSREEKKWSSRRIAIEDPFAKKRNVARSVSHSHVFEYIYDRMRAAFHYFGVPQTRKGPIYTNISNTKLEDKLHKSLSQLHEGAEDSRPKEKRVSKDSGKRRKEHVEEKPQEQSDGDVVVEDIESEDAESDSVKTDRDEKNQNDETDSEVEKLVGDSDDKQTEKVVSDKTSNVNGKLSEQERTQHFVEDLVKDLMQKSLAEIKSQMDKNHVTNESKNDVNTICTLVEELELDELQTSKKSIVTNDKIGEEGDEESSEEDGSSEEEESSADEGDNASSTTEKDEDEDIGAGIYNKDLATQLKKEDFDFKFDKETLADDKGPAIMCSICQQEGHLKQECPEETLPDLESLPPLTQTYKGLLDQILWQVPRDFEPNSRELRMRTDVIKELEAYIRELYPDSNLSLFGSSCNGFGFQHSDLDICMTLGSKRPEELECVTIIQKLSVKLRRHGGLYDVVPITTAKVPIVKFKHRKSGLEGDISLYNTLAQHNTSMLLLYSEIDYRVKVLGYTLKVYAKLCDICDASRGSLSSYAYILMVLYYLQQRKPPVVPVLQELHNGDKPTVLVDEWNAWFYDDLKSLPKVWPEFGQNKESLGELWVGLLRFYTEEFNFQDYVISIRQRQPLTRFEKLWNGKCIAIEDPFDLNHNLGAGISRKMNMYIMKSLRRGRLVFGTPIERAPRNYYKLQDYLFDPHLLTEGQPPNDRGCRVCGKIGHFAKECPIVLARKERQHQEKDKRRQDKEQLERTPDRQKSREDNMSRESGRYQRGHHQMQQSAPMAVQAPRQQFQRSYSQGTPPNMTGSPGSLFSSSPGGSIGSQFFYNAQYHSEMAQYSQSAPSSGGSAHSPIIRTTGGQMPTSSSGRIHHTPPPGLFSDVRLVHGIQDSRNLEMTIPNDHYRQRPQDNAHGNQWQPNHHGNQQQQQQENPIQRLFSR